jgi:hypothetical protein
MVISSVASLSMPRLGAEGRGWGVLQAGLAFMIRGAAHTS